ncbi:hypothetical protein Q5H93_12125 [Hymenobacter sp. ASUV-10]|uniref:Uncharacterized protein n=1 Tax=Hymenobacter aranciens TaxID=3063996 RepID=A0ABT9BB39_9BACT|nr:hypothetical protein [Hymenobacter sp. ASUV-10]MDO7875481.1 hypothetical protein [Hymenobacter sp. ASUV-10]
MKYDDRTKPGFYKTRMEVIDGTKGVDFIAGQPPHFTQVWLLEVKDFREYQAELDAELKAGTLVLEVVQKAVHTCAGLYLAACGKHELIPADLRAAALRPPQWKLVLFLQQDPLPDSPHEQTNKKAVHNRVVQRQDIAKKLRAKLKPLGIGSELAELDHLPKNAGWMVTSA